MKIKVCGITRKQDAETAIELGAWALGFIFYEKSPRFVSPAQARELLAGSNPELKKVGVFVNADKATIGQTIEISGINTAQLHGDETPEFCEALKNSYPEIALIKALRPKNMNDLRSIPAFLKTCQAILIDSYSTTAHGGSGELANWELAFQAKSYGPVILAGGLTAKNIHSALNHVSPEAIDVSSGLEDDPGVKSEAKMREFFQSAKVQRACKTPDAKGWFGPFGGRFAPETLMGPLLELEKAYFRYREDPEFQRELSDLLAHYVGRETPLTFSKRLTDHLGGAKIYLKREDLTHTGAHKINNAIGQILLAKRMGKTRIVAETGAGQHGVATATVAALFGLKCVIYMGRVDMERQLLNVHRMRLLGAEVIPVDAGTRTLKDAVSAAMRDWVTHIRDTFYILGSALGPHPYPLMVRDFQSAIGREARVQILEREGRLPDELVACVGGGSNAIGLFHAFIDDTEVAMTGVEAGGTSISPGNHAARFAGGSLGVLQGTQTFVLQTEGGQIENTHSISAGLDYAAIGPEHAYLRDIGRAQYTYASDQEALHAFHLLARLEGIIPALESSHALAYAIRRAPKLSKDKILLVCLSGRGDKDLATILSQSQEDLC